MPVGDPLLEPAEESDNLGVGTVFADIELVPHQHVNYALAHNGLPFIKSLRIRPLTASFGPIEVRISGRWAAGPLSPIKPFSKIVDTIAETNNWINVDVRDCRLDDVSLAELAEDSPAEIVLELHDRHTSQWQVERHEITVFSRTQWLAAQPEITAAFVQPNHPKVAEILKEASSILKELTGSEAIDGYQALAGGNKDRPRAIARAVFDALGNHIDHYINPPASFNERIGQKLRPLDQILNDGHGTCLDLACGYASVLEQAGLHPIVFLSHGHAFTGVWTTPQTMPQASTDSFATMINRFETGEILPVETTLIPKGAGQFDAAVAHARKEFTERKVECAYCQRLAANNVPTSDRTHLEAAIDIRVCRQERILPLPARVVQGDHIVLVIDKGGDTPPVVERRDIATGELLPSSVPARVQQWKNSLLDLSFRNRLLKFSPSASGLGLLTGSDLVADVEDLVNEGKPLKILSNDSLSDVRREAFQAHLEAAFGVRNVAEAARRHGLRAVQRVLNDDLEPLFNEQQAVFAFTDRGSVPAKAKNLIRDARVEEQDTGVNNLHLTFGMLKWSAQGSDVGDVTSPIFLVPVKMVLKRGAVVPELRLDEASSTSINYCLIEALKARAHLDLEWFKRDIRDHAGLDVKGGLLQLREEIHDRGLDTQFGFEVTNSLSVGLLRFNKIRLWKDLDEHWDRFNSSPVVHHFISRVGESFVDPVIEQRTETPSLDDTTLLNPQPADGAQSAAILKAISGETFVLEGPPGTGKSQTITNLLANALAHGLKVLFVAEKQAALDVVNERLEEVGLMPFCLDLHDKGSTTKQIKEQLLKALDFVPENQGPLWESHATNFSALAERLDRYHDDLHEREIGGSSYYDAYRRIVELGDGPAVQVGREILGASDALIGELRTLLAGIENYTDAAQPRPGHPWSFATSTSFESIDRTILVSHLKSVISHHHHLAASASSLATLTAAASSLDDLDIAIELASLANAGIDLTEQILSAASRPAWKERMSSLTGQAIVARSAMTDAVGTITADHWSLDTEAVSRRVSEAASSFFLGRNKRIEESLGLLQTSPLLRERNPKNINELLKRVTNAIDEAKRTTQELLSASDGLRLLDGHPYEANVLESAQLRINAIASLAGRSAAGDDFARAVRSATTSALLFPEEDFKALSELRNSLETIGTQLGATDDSWNLWLLGDTFATAISRSESVWSNGLDDGSLITLNRWTALIESLEPLNIPGLFDCRTAILTGAIPGHQASSAFDRGLSDTILQVVGEQAQFDIFDHHAHNRRVGEFANSLSTRQDLLKLIIPQMLHARRSFDSTSQAGRIGRFRTDLRATRRSRGSQSIRAMVESYHDLIAELTPCFLMSPDSVAKFVPPGSIQFDLVVFDEASQIQVADAIGALGRATSAVIVGDSKQMPPTMVAQARIGSGDDEVIPVQFMDDDQPELTPAPEDAESILEECVASGVPQDMLSWHYRSRDEVLIAFSNQHYYDGRLASFPAPSQAQPGCGIEYHRVDGQFDHGKSRTNIAEADAIVQHISDRVHHPDLSKFSIGVVTLNMEQRKLITQKLLDTNDDAILDLLETDDKEKELFVLNLESVQGRERDVIILGTAFSKRSDGSPMPLNFGPLTNPRGERRLNVAVTRARRQMVIFSSFDPTELAGANSTGMVHLRNYLTLAKQASESPESLDHANSPETNDPYIDEIAEAIAQRGHIVRRGYGLSAFKVDVAVAPADDPSKFTVAVLADGRTWGNRRLVLDRDALPVNVLGTLMDWPNVVRVWLPSWRARRDEVLDAIDEVLRNPNQGSPAMLKSEPGAPNDTLPSSSPAKSTTFAPPRTDSSPSLKGFPEVDERPSEERPYITWPEQVLGDSTDLDQVSARFRSTVEKIIEVEGPIEETDLLKKAANAFGLSRLSAKRQDSLRVAIPSAQRFESPFGVFVYPTQLISNNKVSDSFTWFRIYEDQRRDVASLSPEELRNMCLEIARSTGGIEQEELVRTVLLKLGYSKVAASTREVAEKRIQQLIDLNWLRIVDDHIIAD